MPVIVGALLAAWLFGAVLALALARAAGQPAPAPAEHGAHQHDAA